MKAPNGGRQPAPAGGNASDQAESQPINVAEIFSGLDAPEAEAVIALTRDRSYPRGSSIYSLGEHQGGIFLVKTGLIEEYRLTEGGQRLPINRVAPGQLFGLSAVDKHYCCFAEAVKESTVGFLSFEELEGACRDSPRVAVNLIELLARRLGDIEERLQLLAFSGLRARVAWALLGLSAIHGPALEGITHEALATWAAGSRPKVSGVLEELEQSGVLRLARNSIHIIDPVRLEEWAKGVSSL